VSKNFDHRKAGLLLENQLAAWVVFWFGEIMSFRVCVANPDIEFIYYVALMIIPLPLFPIHPFILYNFLL